MQHDPLDSGAQPAAELHADPEGGGPEAPAVVAGGRHEPPQGDATTGDRCDHKGLGPETLADGAGIVRFLTVDVGEHGTSVRSHCPSDGHPPVRHRQAAGVGHAVGGGVNLTVGADDLHHAQVGEVGNARVSHLQDGLLVILQGGVEDAAGGRQQVEALEGLFLAKDGYLVGAAVACFQRGALHRVAVQPVLHCGPVPKITSVHTDIDLRIGIATRMLEAPQPHVMLDSIQLDV